MKKPFFLFLILLLAAPSFAFALVDDSNTKALLHFDGNLVDESGKVWTGLNNPVFEPGVFGQAIGFNGNDQGIVTGDHVDFNITDGQPLTIELRLWLNALPACGDAGKISLFSQGNSITNFVNLEIFNNCPTGYALVFEAASGGTRIAAAYLQNLTANTWNHIVVQKNGGTYSFYQNCVRIYNSTPPALAFNNYTGKVYIGRFFNGGLGVNGRIEEFRFSRAIRYTGATCTLPTSEFGSNVTATPSLTPTMTRTATPTVPAPLSPTATSTPTFLTHIFQCPMGQVVGTPQFLDPRTVQLTCANE